MGQQWSFDIETSTHELLREGITAGRFSGSFNNHQRVIVWADTWIEASEIAIQIGMCFGYVTKCMTRI